MIKRALLGLVVVLVLLVVVLVVRTASYSSRQLDVPPVTDIAIDADGAAHRLARALTFRTISHEDPTEFDAEAFLGFREYLDATFPLVRSALNRELVADYSLLYRWDGSDTNLKPVVLMAHMDAVPVEPGTESDWTHPPFGGEIKEGYIWGRAAMDDKGSLIAILEALETLLTQGFQPRRSVYLAFGHDEEVGGRQGALAIANLLASRQVEPEFVLDEGGAIAEGLTPGTDVAVALVGVAEKGYVSLQLTVETSGGHSSMPPPQTAVGILSAAIDQLQRNPIPGGIRGATAAMFDYLGPELPFVQRLFVANRWLFGWAVERAFGASPEGNALVRTTTAPTIFEGGVKANVLPASARAVVNFRILPGDSIGSVTEHVRRTIDDPRISIERIGFAREPSPISDIESSAFGTVQRTIGHVFPDVIVIPWLVVGGTDARYFRTLTPNVYRFDGGRVGPGDTKRIHGTDERVSTEDHAAMVRFYVQLLRNSTT